MANEFDSLMSGMGVKRMDAGGDRKNPRSKSKPKVATKRRPATPAKAQPPAENTVNRIAVLERALTMVKDERAKAEAKALQLQGKVKRLKAELAELAAFQAEVPPTVVDVLTEWGFDSPDSRLALLLADGWMERLLAEPNLADAVALQTEVRKTFIRVCEQCSPPPGLTAMPSLPERCAVCGGFDLNRESRRFVDAALINGRLRVVVVGRTAQHHRWIRERVADKRLVLTQIPGASQRETSQAQVDVDHADAVIVWDPESISANLLAVYRTAPRMGEVPAGPLGSLLSAAAAIIAQD